jgi:alanyl-tRNA synthetase
LTAFDFKRKGYTYNETDFEVELQSKSAYAASEVSTEDWSVLIPGNVETFVGYDKTENEVKITCIRKVDSKKRRNFISDRFRQYTFYPEGGDKWVIKEH